MKVSTKRLLSVVLGIVLTVSMIGLAIAVKFIGTPTASAEEIASVQTENIPTTDEVIDSMGGNLTEEDKAVIKDIITKLKEYTESSDSFFVKNIVPILVAGALCFVAGLLFIIPWLKGKYTLKSLKNALENASKKVAECKAEVESYKALIDVNALKNEIKEYTVVESKKLVEVLLKTLDANNITYEKILNVLMSLKDGAINAWQGSPEAVACLTENADAKVLTAKVEENAKMKAYIAEKHGESGLKELGII